jgi:hypothetical protein|tara:strand:- start:923 stop:1972 length:1050 start_codon:yes stop_codon:yes gene_type:complete
MPGLIGSQGIRPGALNMGRVFRALRYRTEQAQVVTYYRPPIYTTDDYGVPFGTKLTEELLLPDLPAIIRPAVTANFQHQRDGNNIIGAARIYTPNMNTIKGVALSGSDGISNGNFNQYNNAEFNEIEGWDRLITNYRTIYNIWTSGTSETVGNNQYAWTNAGAGVLSSDGESVTVTGVSTSMTYTPTVAAGINSNILEADRLRFKIKTNDTNLVLTSVVVTNSSGKTLTYTPAALTVSQNTWLSVDLPYISGTVEYGTSIFQEGARKAVTVTSSIVAPLIYDYEKDLVNVTFNYTGPIALTDTVQIRQAEFYKSVSWHVHALKDMTDGYIIFDCVRTSGRDDARRRAED